MGKASFKPLMCSKGGHELLFQSPTHLSTASYSHVEVLLCVLYVILDFWGNVKPQLFGHWQRNRGGFDHLRFLPAQRNGSV